jgi:hypothetical protein
MGYKLSDEEIERLIGSIGGSRDCVSRAKVIASQIDWRYMQQYQKERWLVLARRAFNNIDADADGCVTVGEIVHALEDRIPSDALYDLFYGSAGGTIGGAGTAASSPIRVLGNAARDRIGALRPMSFQSFMQLLRQPSEDSLDLYDDRQDGTVTTLRSDHSGPSAGDLRSASLRGHAHGLGVSPGADCSKSPTAASLGSSCAVDALRDVSVRTRDCSTHHGRELATVFERWEP